MRYDPLKPDLTLKIDLINTERVKIRFERVAAERAMIFAPGL